MLFISKLSIGALAAIFASAAAQTWTSCNPMEKECPPNPALGTTHTWNLTNSTLDSDSWNVTSGAIDYSSSLGSFVVKTKGDSPTIQSNFYIFWGSVSVIMKSAKGQGIVSSIVLQSDDLDEVDWEWIGGNSTHVQSNYFGKGNTETYNRDEWHPVQDPQNTWHNYTTVWTQERLEWWIDGKQVRVLPQGRADGNGKFYPQTPVTVKIGIWSGGDSNQPGTVSWAGGKTNYDEAPFSMVVGSIYVNDGTKNATEYSYGDKSGSSKSIKVAKGKSAIADKLSQPPPQTINQKFNNLSVGAKVAIFASVGAIVIALIALFFVCCFKQRKAGRREREVEDANWEKNNAELLAYRSKMADGGFSHAGPAPRKANVF